MVRVANESNVTRMFYTSAKNLRCQRMLMNMHWLSLFVVIKNIKISIKKILLIRLAYILSPLADIIASWSIWEICKNQNNATRLRCRRQRRNGNDKKKANGNTKQGSRKSEKESKSKCSRERHQIIMRVYFSVSLSLYLSCKQIE